MKTLALVLTLSTLHLATVYAQSILPKTQFSMQFGDTIEDCKTFIQTMDLTYNGNAETNALKYPYAVGGN